MPSRGECMTRAKQPKPRMSFSHLLRRLFGWAVFIIIFALLGYATILFGGNWVVDDVKMVLDATTTIETADGDVIGELYQENRVPVDLGDLPEHVKNALSPSKTGVFTSMLVLISNLSCGRCFAILSLWKRWKER